MKTVSVALLPLLAAAIMSCTAKTETETEAVATPEPSESAAPSAEAAPDENYVPAEQVADIPIERVGFEDGNNATTIEGSITGYATIDYVFRASEGDPLNISMATQHTATYFNLIEPGETDVAVFNGSMGENMFEGTAAKSGDYRVRVYMMRSAARREETADYRLEIIVG
ncbi:hypothetical protein [Croceicoccus naphthovorans]|uniref:hypothetical protein n=1 Tax=Croceicoccus naphthovorans TaxID=1348774 RepID=UPI00069EED80|nr:hypothetical protein [Croceicoccus naphthovorans]MBB3990530.1 hypothetical protein [Croceicoccus naphthovorans]